MSTQHSPFDIIMLWYQNDWGLYGRRNESIARALLKHKHVRSVMHVEPPLDLEQLRSRLSSDCLDDNVHTNLKRVNLTNDKGVFLFTPHVLSGLSERKISAALRAQLDKAIAECGMENIVLWLYPPHPFADFALATLKERVKLVVSDCVDDHRQYARTEAERFIIENRYKNIVCASDIVFCVSKSLRDDMRQFNPRTFYIPNAVSADLLDREKPPTKPAAMADIARPIIGYTGALSLRIDADLLGYVARTRPEWNIVLIGTSPAGDVKALFDLPNVHWLGPLRHEELHAHIAHFDVGIVPHTVNAMTENMNPLKIYEYLAHGKPVVSTDVAGVGMFQADIAIAGNKQEFVSAIADALAQDSIVLQRKRVDRIRSHTWTDRIDEMMRLMMRAQEATTSSKETASSQRYYSFDRPEVRACIPEDAGTILDVGCAAGRLGATLKQERDCFVMGVEYEPEIANEARFHLDDVMVGDIEEKGDHLPSDYFDCIVLADVLEHLRSPETFLKKISRPLKGSGKIIASIPNVRHWSVVRSLLEGNWDYVDAGILDRTHLRFFTRSSILKLFADTGYSITDMSYTTVGDPNAMLQPISQALSIAGLDTSTLAEEAEHYQYIVTAEKNLQQSLVSIIILTCNQLEYTQQCLESIQNHTPEAHEIIFVDNGSTDGTVEWLKGLTQEHVQYTLIENARNLGFAKGCNQGIEVAQGSYILLLNNDVVVTPGWLAGLLTSLTSAEDIGMVGPLSNAVSGPQLVEDIPYGNDMERMQSFAQDLARNNDGQTQENMRLVGFCLLMKRAVVDIIGGLDESYGNGNFEDDDFCLRSYIAGFRHLIVRNVFIHHWGSMTFKGNAIDYQASMQSNIQYFGEKWKDILEVNGNQYKVWLTKKQQLKILLNWGEERFSQGDVRTAIKIFERILRIDSTNAEALNNLGVIQWQLGDTTSAMSTFQSALNINPKDPDALGNLVQAATEMGRFDLIKPELLEILKQTQPANPHLKTIIDAKQKPAENP